MPDPFDFFTDLAASDVFWPGVVVAFGFTCVAWLASVAIRGKEF